MAYYLVINLGLRSIRAIVYDEYGVEQAKSWYPVETIVEGLRIEQNPQEWWQLTELLFRDLFEARPDFAIQLHSITVTSSASCLVVVDNNHESLMNALLVSDKRAHEHVQELKDLPHLQSYLHDHPHAASAAYMPAKLLWLKKHKPSIFSECKYVLSANDYFVLKLTGKASTDILNAEKFYYDPEKKSYPKPLLKQLTITAKQLPKVHASGHVVGPIIPRLRKKYGISARAQVVLTSYDAICAIFGSGATELGDVCNVCGTVSSVRALATADVNSTILMKQSLQNYTLLGGSNNIDGGLLEWAKGMFYGDAYSDQHVYQIMQDEASQSPPGANGLFFIPYILGERFPIVDHHARGIFFGLERFHTRADIMRSIYEASAYMLNGVLQEMKASGVKINTVYFSGGLARSTVACEIRADVTGHEVVVPDDIETTAKGACYLMMLSKQKSGKKVVREYAGSAYKPNKKNHQLYASLEPLFHKVYNVNKELMKERGELMDSLLLVQKHTLRNL